MMKHIVFLTEQLSRSVGDAHLAFIRRLVSAGWTLSGLEGSDCVYSCVGVYLA